MRAASNVMMRIVSTLLGLVMIAMGTVWVLQGLNLAFRVGFMVGDKHYKLDDAGNAKVKEYLKDAKSLKVTVDAKADGEKLTDIASIKAAEGAEEKK